MPISVPSWNGLSQNMIFGISGSSKKACGGFDSAYFYRELFLLPTLGPAALGFLHLTQALAHGSMKSPVSLAQNFRPENSVFLRKKTGGIHFW
jgi:hypothetical protein